MSRRAEVRLSGTRVGELWESSDGYTFTYDTQWLNAPNRAPISLTMPLRDEPYVSAKPHPFFANLLPEGWLLDLSTARLKIAADDTFGLVSALCRDCMGAVEVLPLATPNGASDPGERRAEP